MMLSCTKLTQFYFYFLITRDLQTLSKSRNRLLLYFQPSFALLHIILVPPQPEPMLCSPLHLSPQYLLHLCYFLYRKLAIPSPQRHTHRLPNFLQTIRNSNLRQMRNARRINQRYPIFNLPSPHPRTVV